MAKSRRKLGNRSKYIKIPLHVKHKLYKKVFVQAYSIRDASTLFGINYSTAKTLIRQRKNETFTLKTYDQETDPISRPFVRCEYMPITPFSLPIKIISTCSETH